MEQQKIAPIQLNFNPSTKPEMFGVSIERGKEIAKEIDIIVDDIVDNKYREYIVEGSGENQGRHRLHEGRILERALNLALNQNEWLFVLFMSTNLFDAIKQAREYKQRNSAMPDFVKQLAEALNLQGMKTEVIDLTKNKTW